MEKKKERTTPGTWLRCQRCKHEWEYKGTKKRYVQCSNTDCRTSVTIAKSTIEAKA